MWVRGRGKVAPKNHIYVTVTSTMPFHKGIQISKVLRSCGDFFFFYLSKIESPLKIALYFFKSPPSRIGLGLTRPGFSQTIENHSCLTLRT